MLAEGINPVFPGARAIPCLVQDILRNLPAHGALVTNGGEAIGITARAPRQGEMGAEGGEISLWDTDARLR